MLVKDLEKLIAEGKPVRKSLTIADVEDVKGVDENGEPIQSLTFTITSDAKDRDGDIIDSKGWLFDNFNANPVMQWAHRYDEVPIAKSIKVWKNNQGKVKSTVIFQPDSNYQPNWAGITGSMIYNMYKTGFLNAVSVGFDPIKWEPLQKEDGDESSRSWEGTHYLKQELLEFSGVPVPSNPEALLDPASVKEFKKQLKMWATQTLKQCECDIDDKDDKAMKPYANEHACRLRNPDDFQANTFRRTERDHEGKKYSVIMGRLTGETTMTEQAYRYNKDTWTAAQARSHCSDHDGAFEAAAAESGLPELEKSETEGIMQNFKEQIIKTVREQIEKSGRVLSGDNEKELTAGVEQINAGTERVKKVLAKVQQEESATSPEVKEQTDPAVTEPVTATEPAPAEPPTTTPTATDESDRSQSSDVPPLDQNQEGTEGGDTQGTTEDVGEGEELIEVDVDELREELDAAVQSVVDETLTDLGLPLSGDKPAAA